MAYSIPPALRGTKNPQQQVAHSSPFGNSREFQAENSGRNLYQRGATSSNSPKSDDAERDQVRTHRAPGLLPAFARFYEDVFGRNGSSQVDLPPTYTQDSGIDDENEPPLLDELGIIPGDILKRMKAVCFFSRLEHDFMIHGDMSGPLLIALALGICLLLSGKPTFSYIYALAILGCISLYILLNLMAQVETITLYLTVSILGYGLLPVVVLAAVSIVFPLRNLTGSILALVCIFWCTATASRFFESALKLSHQRYLVAYPISILYTFFVIVTIF